MIKLYHVKRHFPGDIYRYTLFFGCGFEISAFELIMKQSIFKRRFTLFFGPWRLRTLSPFPWLWAKLYRLHINGHSVPCWERWLSNRMARALYRWRWPYHCKMCEGAGGWFVDNGPNIHPEWDECRAMGEHDCHRCGKMGLSNSWSKCRFCGWHSDTPFSDGFRMARLYDCGSLCSTRLRNMGGVVLSFAYQAPRPQTKRPKKRRSKK